MGEYAHPTSSFLHDSKESRRGGVSFGGPLLLSPASASSMKTSAASMEAAAAEVAAE